jgi:cyclic 2,3-diphosphoglycerate synthetase
MRLEPDVVVFDGSGAALPPVATDRTVLVVGGHQAADVAAGFLNTYRLLVADVVVVTMADDDVPWRAVVESVTGVVRAGTPVVATVLRPRPLADVSGRTVAYFSTAPRGAHSRLEEHLERVHGARVVHVSGSLADRDALRAELVGLDAEVYLVELKAAAIDVVAEAALVAGADVVLAANDVVSIGGERELDEVLLEMAKFGG